MRWPWLLDHTEIPSADLAALYRRRWAEELYLKDIKTAMELDIHRCKSPGMVQPELCAGFLAYNLIRQSLLQTACSHDELPEHLTFTATLQFLASTWLAAALVSPPSSGKRDRLVKLRLTHGHSHRVGNRLNRIAPAPLNADPRPTTCSRYLGIKPAPNGLTDAHRSSLRCIAQCYSGPGPARVDAQPG